MPPSRSSTPPRGDQHEHDRGWTDDGHTIVPYIECESAGVRILCPGPGRCTAKYGCEECSASGYVNEPGPDGDEIPCPVCAEEGKDPARLDRCWLIETISYIDTTAALCANGMDVDVNAGHEIVWQDHGAYDDPQPWWKSKGVESYEAQNRRRAAERKAEMEAQRAH